MDFEDKNFLKNEDKTKIIQIQSIEERIARNQNLSAGHSKLVERRSDKGYIANAP